MARGRIKSSKTIEKEIKVLQEKLEKAKIREQGKKFSLEVCSKLEEILKNHGYEFTDGEINVIVEPCENLERIYASMRKRMLNG